MEISAEELYRLVNAAYVEGRLDEAVTGVLPGCLAYPTWETSDAVESLKALGVPLPVAKPAAK